MTDTGWRFPQYGRAERWLDGALHVGGVPLALAASTLLLVEAVRPGRPLLAASIAIYVVGLVGMLAASAAYHLTRPSRAKELLRRVDHAMIFVMIAGTYTPFALNALPPAEGALLCGAMWACATGGVALKLVAPRRFERLSLALCLAMGWSVLPLLPALAARLSAPALWLLLAGGLAYTVGAVFYTLRRLRFHTAVWHFLVLVGAGLHLGALRLAFLAG